MGKQQGARPKVKGKAKVGGKAKIVAHARTLQLPPMDSRSRRVSTESRNGTCAGVLPCRPPPPSGCVRAAMTLPRASSDVLIFLASASVVPVAPERPWGHTGRVERAW